MVKYRVVYKVIESESEKRVSEKEVLIMGSPQQSGPIAV